MITPRKVHRINNPVFLIGLASLIAAAQFPPPVPVDPIPIRLGWDYPTNELSTNLWFHLYSHTNPAAPLSQWTIETSVVGTSTTVRIAPTPGHRFYVVTASNLWGESRPSEPYATPFPPRVGRHLTAARED
ncbi:MAG: hypothetical protein KF833_18680 [Verrucomicrobiae bacterium]|nr:hypothetical protein [Verrucomicrobiae bacterium]